MQQTTKATSCPAPNSFSHPPESHPDAGCIATVQHLPDLQLAAGSDGAACPGIILDSEEEAEPGAKSESQFDGLHASGLASGTELPEPLRHHTRSAQGPSLQHGPGPLAEGAPS